MNIRNFQPGQKITRVRLATNTYGQEDIDDELAGVDLMGEELTLKSIEHGCIYLESSRGNVKLLMHDILGYNWTEGWEPYLGMEKPLVKKSDRNWFYAGLGFHTLLMMAMCALNVPSITFYSLLGIGMVGLSCFIIYITKIEP